MQWNIRNSQNSYESISGLPDEAAPLLASGIGYLTDDRFNSASSRDRLGRFPLVPRALLMSRSALTYNVVVESIYRASVEPDFWPNALTHLADHTGALGGLIAYHAPAVGEDFMVIGRLRPDLTDLYLKEYAHNDYSAAMMHAKPGVIYAAEQLADYDAVKKTAFHADILAPQKIRTQLVVGHPSLTRHGTSGGVALQLSRRHAADVENVTRRFSRLVPHLMRGIELTLQIGRHQTGTSWVERLLDAIPHSALLLGRDGTIVFANRAAETLLATADGLSITRNIDGLRLTAAKHSERTLLALRIAQALRCAGGDEGELGGAFRITRPSGRAPLIVLVIPLPPPAFSLIAAFDGGTRVLVEIMDPHLPVDVRAEQLAMAAGLTVAEQRVAALVGSGLKAPEVARALGVSLPTVKTHLSRCFDKTGIRSQTELARLVSSVFCATRYVSRTE